MSLRTVPDTVLILTKQKLRNRMDFILKLLVLPENGQGYVWKAQQEEMGQSSSRKG